uniref:Motile sperm domain-containing protein 1 n=2 Tax=Lygus hesperus TaxID=30085 RepID=A0A0A9WL75_LYGHE
MQSGSAFEGKIPVFAFPTSVDFYLEDHRTHKRLLTVYNPYDFAVRFKVLCTAPDKYEVSGPEGKIKARCQVDVVFRHKALSPANCNVTDKFRIQMQHNETKQVIGKKDIPATLHSGVAPKQEDDDVSVTSADRASTEWKMSKMNSHESLTRNSKVMVKGSPSPLVWLTGVICFICLLLPNEGEPSSLSITVPHHFKLVFSYVLGLVTMVIFRQ